MLSSHGKTSHDRGVAVIFPGSFEETGNISSLVNDEAAYTEHTVSEKRYKTRSPLWGFVRADNSRTIGQ